MKKLLTILVAASVAAVLFLSVLSASAVSDPSHAAVGGIWTNMPTNSNS